MENILEEKALEEVLAAAPVEQPQVTLTAKAA